MSAWRGQLAVTTCVAGRIAAEGAHPWAIPSRASMPERRVESAKRANAEKGSGRIFDDETSARNMQPPVPDRDDKLDAGAEPSA